jgi:hypothetical protein
MGVISERIAKMNPDAIPRRIWRHLYWKAIHPIRNEFALRMATAGDPGQRRVLKLVAPYTMVAPPRLMNAWDLVKRVEAAGLPGAIVECGVFKGGTSGVMAAASSSAREIWLFDSFEGLPQPTEADGLKAHEYANGRSTGALSAIDQCVGPLASVQELFFDVLRVDPRRVQIRKGWFQETLPEARHEVGPIAVLRLDGDWYESTRVCLENLYDLVPSGGFVIIDDYGYWEGCRRAVDEFLAARQLKVELVAVDDTGVWWQVP